MPAVPGQRAVQRPVQAAMAAQRALGQAVTANVSEAVSPHGVAILNGQYYDVDLSGPVPKLVPRGPVHPSPDTPPAGESQAAGHPPDTASAVSGQPVSGHPVTDSGTASELGGHRPDKGSPDTAPPGREGPPADTEDTTSGHATSGRPDTKRAGGQP